LNITAGSSVNLLVARASAIGTSGGTTVTLSNVSNGPFAAGQLVLLHQTQGATGAGNYEYARLASATATTLTLTTALVNSYATGGTSKAQVMVVSEFTNLSIASGAVLTAPAWNGNTGGILPLNASGAATVDGTITMNQAGFRGTSHAACSTRYLCQHGVQGESHLGVGTANYVPNGPGGGGGSQGQDGACGAGGSHGTVGTNGNNGTSCGNCSVVCSGGLTLGGSAGPTAGSSSLVGNILFGAAGGEGGADEDGAWPGPGGTGGGIILLRANSLTVTGSITANGANGGDGVSGGGCGGGCGQGGGGGGAGGAIRIAVTAASNVGTSLITALGSTGGVETCSAAKRGGSGGNGRVGIKGPSITGTSNPAFDTN